MLTAPYCLSTNPILRCWGCGRLLKRMQSLSPFLPSPQLPLGFSSLRTRAFLAPVNSLSPVLPSLDMTDRRGTARSLILAVSNLFILQGRKLKEGDVISWTTDAYWKATQFPACLSNYQNFINSHLLVCRPCGYY